MEQKTCPPCRQPMSNYDQSIFVDFDNSRVYVCCSGCAKKMEQYWNGYITILDSLGEKPLSHQSEQPLNTPLTTNSNNKGVCGPCKTGLCMLKEHLPPEAIAQNPWSTSIGNMYGKLFHSPSCTL